MNALVKANYLIFKLETHDKKCYIQTKSLVGIVDGEIVEKKNKNNKLKKYGLNNVFLKDGFDNGTIIIQSKKPNIVQLPIKEDKTYCIGQKNLLALDGDLEIVKKQRGFFSKSQTDNLLYIKGTGNIYIMSNTSKILQFAIKDNKINKFNSNNVLMFDADLIYNNYKKTREENVVSFSGNGMVYFGI